MTDGKQTETPDSKSLDQASRPLKQAGVRIITVGIGKYANRKELRLMTDNDDDVLMLQSFNDLTTKLGTLKMKSCEGKYFLFYF